MSDNIFKGMIKEYKKVVQIPFEEYKEKTKKDKKEVFQFMVHKMANDDIKLFESLEKKGEYIDLLEDEIERLNNIIKEVRERLMKANIYKNYDDDEDDTIYTDLNIEEVLEILDKVGDKE